MGIWHEKVDLEIRKECGVEVGRWRKSRGEWWVRGQGNCDDPRRVTAKGHDA